MDLPFKIAAAIILGMGVLCALMLFSSHIISAGTTLEDTEKTLFSDSQDDATKLLLDGEKETDKGYVILDGGMLPDGGGQLNRLF